MNNVNQDTAWKLAIHELLRRVIADNYFSSDKHQFQRQLDGLLNDTLAAIDTKVSFPGVADSSVADIKNQASDTVRRIVTTIKPA